MPENPMVSTLVSDHPAVPIKREPNILRRTVERLVCTWKAQTCLSPAGGLAGGGSRRKLFFFFFAEDMPRVNGSLEIACQKSKPDALFLATGRKLPANMTNVGSLSLGWRVRGPAAEVAAAPGPLKAPLHGPPSVPARPARGCPPLVKKPGVGEQGATQLHP